MVGQEFAWQSVGDDLSVTTGEQIAFDATEHSNRKGHTVQRPYRRRGSAGGLLRGSNQGLGTSAAYQSRNASQQTNDPAKLHPNYPFQLTECRRIRVFGLTEHPVNDEGISA